MIYKEVTKNQLVEDMQSKGFSAEQGEAIYDYLEKHYTVKNYNADFIAEKFEVVTLDTIKVMCQTDYKEFYDTFFVSYDNITDSDYVQLWEDCNQYNFVQVLKDNKTCLFDKNFYTMNWEDC